MIDSAFLSPQLSFPREVEIIASTLQPASTVHTFTFTLPAPSTPLAPSASTDLLRASVLTSTTDPRSSVLTFPYPYPDDPFARQGRPSSAFLGPPSTFLSPHGHNAGAAAGLGQTTVKSPLVGGAGNNITYHGVCLTVWSHADAERTAAIRRTLETSRARKESANSLVHSTRGKSADPVRRRRHKGPWGAGTDAETDMEGAETDADIDTGAVSESDFEVASTVGHGPGESTLFLPGDTVFWLPYALSECFACVDTSIIHTEIASRSSRLEVPHLRSHARLPHAFVGALLQGRAVAHAADQ